MMTSPGDWDANPADVNTLRRLAALADVARREGLRPILDQLRAALRERGRLGPRLRRTGEAALKVGVPALAHAVLSPLFGRPRELYVFYDLAVSPVTYDICWALAIAETLRRERELDGVRVIVVPGREGGLRREAVEYERAVNAPERRHRIDAILLPAARLLPSLVELRACRSRWGALWQRVARARHVYPERYWPGIPSAHRPGDLIARARAGQAVALPFRPGPATLQAARDWLEPLAAGRRVVTITLRQYAAAPARNSDVTEWAAFAAGLDAAAWCVVVVPDTAEADAPPEPALAAFAHCPRAARELGFRAALYREAYLNLMVNNGPHGLCMFDSETAYLMFKITTPGAPETSEASMREQGFAIGEDPPFALPWQHWVWQEDRRDVISAAFERMCTILAGRGDDPPGR